MGPNKRMGALACLGLIAAYAIQSVACGSSSTPATNGSHAYALTGLVSDVSGATSHTDSNLVNPWGIAAGQGTPFFVANNHSGTFTEYDGSGNTSTPPHVVTIAAPGGGMGAPSGLVHNSTSDFMGDEFIAATEDGTIAGFSSTGTSATIRADRSGAGAVYKGIALGAVGDKNYVYATDFVNGTIDVFDGSYSMVTLGAFKDPTLPADFHPFGIANLEGKLFVTYGQHQGTDTDEAHGAGLGYVSVFGMDGTFQQRVASQGVLNAPWGLALSPTAFGQFTQAILVGNFGDGHITAFNPITYEQLGQLSDTSGAPLAIDGLWGLAFGNGSGGASTSTLYITAGPSDENHGLFGSIDAVASTADAGVVSDASVVHDASTSGSDASVTHDAGGSGGGGSGGGGSGGGGGGSGY